MRLGFSALFGAVLGGSGLFFLAGLGLERVPGLSWLLRAMPTWDQALFGASWHFTALWASAIPLVGLTILGLGFRRLRTFLAGLAVGWAAHLAVSAIAMPADVLWIPGAASILDRLWLIAHAGLLALLASLVLKVTASRAR